MGIGRTGDEGSLPTIPVTIRKTEYSSRISTGSSAMFLMTRLGTRAQNPFPIMMDSQKVFSRMLRRRFVSVLATIARTRVTRL